jgi:hypothetical protein
LTVLPKTSILRRKVARTAPDAGDAETFKKLEADGKKMADRWHSLNDAQPFADLSSTAVPLAPSTTTSTR